VSELGFQKASLKQQSKPDTFEIEIKEPKPDPPPPPRPAPDVIERVFRAPFTAAGRIGRDSTADTSGSLGLFGTASVATSFQDLALVSQTVPVESGVRRIRVYATFPQVYYQLTGFVALGYASAEAIVNLRVIEGSRVLASDRVSLGRVIGPVIGGGWPDGERPVTLYCEFARDASGVPATYSLIAEFEGWTGSGGIALAHVGMYGVLQQFQVFLDRR
jgi:hypothetical protein